MIVGNIHGGLGNQMFQYACARALSLELGLPLKFTIDFLNANNSHNGFELERAFSLKLDIADKMELAGLISWWCKAPAVRRDLGKFPFSSLTGHNFIGEPHFRYWPALHEHARHGGYLQGNWQSERYFIGYAASIRAEFKFREELLGVNRCMAHKMNEVVSISVHVRRGDYINNSNAHAVHGTCSLEYYHKAIDTLLQRCPGARLFAFSDDAQWVSQVLQPDYPNMEIVAHNKGLDSYNDMHLMSMCRHHVIANSTFSWWGAWLNHRQDKIVIAPKRWFANGIDTQDLIPKEWGQI